MKIEIESISKVNLCDLCGKEMVCITENKNRVICCPNPNCYNSAEVNGI